MSHTQTENLLHRLAIIKGHIEAIALMIEENKSCPEVIVQIVAVRSALNQVARIIIKDHAEHCLVDASQGSDFEAELARFRKALDLII